MMRRRFHAFLLPLALAIVTSTSFAAADEGDETLPDARLEGYTRATSTGPLVINPSSGTASTWVMVVILGGACFGAMCKSGKRTHLD